MEKFRMIKHRIMISHCYIIDEQTQCSFKGYESIIEQNICDYGVGTSMHVFQVMYYIIVAGP